MVRTCTVCANYQRNEIDVALVSGRPFRDIARQYGLSKSSVERHAAEHLPAALVQSQQAGEVARADDLIARVCSLQGRAMRILDKAEEAGSLGLALSAIREVRGVIELLARLLATAQAAAERESAESRPLTGADIIMSPGYQQVMAWVNRELSDRQRITFASLLGSDGYVDDPERDKSLLRVQPGMPSDSELEEMDLDDDDDDDEDEVIGEWDEET